MGVCPPVAMSRADRLEDFVEESLIREFGPGHMLLARHVHLASRVALPRHPKRALRPVPHPLGILPW